MSDLTERLRVAGEIMRGERWAFWWTNYQNQAADALEAAEAKLARLARLEASLRESGSLVGRFIADDLHLILHPEETE